MKNQEVIFNILDLLEIMEEDLTYIKERIQKTKILKDRFNILVKEYEKESGHKFYEIMQLLLDLVFKKQKWN